MLKWIKDIFHLLGHASTEVLSRENRKLHVFDLVSRVQNPRPQDVYMVYSFSDKDVYFLKWSDYCKGKTFDANIDKQVCYTLWEAEDNFYKIDGYSARPSLVFKHSSATELRTFIARFQHTFFGRLPLLGVFVDPNDHHLMMVVDIKGTVEDGVATVYDLSLAPLAGIVYFKQVAHVVRVKDLINNYMIRPIEAEEFVTIMQRPWRKEVLESFTALLFKAIRETEARHDCKYNIYCKGLTTCDLPVQQNGTTTQQQPTKNKETKNEEIG